MELKEYIKTILESVEDGHIVNFDIGIRPGVGKQKGKVFADYYSNNKIKI